MSPKSSWSTRSLAFLLLIVSGGAACGSSTDPSPLNIIDTFASRLAVKGYAWRTFVVSTAGTVQIQLTNTTVASATVGLGIGTVVANDCALSTSLSTVARSASEAPQISQNLSTGTYCVKVYDDGSLTAMTNFTVTITKPF